MSIQPMTEEEWNKKWPMSKIPDGIREVVVAWSGHLFIKDKVKFAQDLLEATEKHRLEYAQDQAIAFAEWLATWGWEMLDLNGPRSGMWVSPSNVQYGDKSLSDLYTDFLDHQKQKV
jgi:hypothetical protein